MIERAEADVKRADPTSVLALTTDRAFLLWRGCVRAASYMDRRGRQTKGATSAGLQAWADGRTKTNIAPKNVHALFFLVVGDIVTLFHPNKRVVHSFNYPT